MNIKHKLADAIKESIGIQEVQPHIDLVEPKGSQFGDYSTSIAFTLYRGRNPFEVATELISQIKLDIAFVDKIENKGGYINFWLNHSFVQQCLNNILEEGARFGSSNIGGGKKVLVEFVSTNPTGPLVIVSGRAASVGDSLVRVLNYTGFLADAEYYVDDSGKQIDLLEESIKARYNGLEDIPEGGYPGEYIKDIASRMKLLCRADFREFGIKSIIGQAKVTLERFGVRFNNWVYESDIRKAGGPQKVVAILEQKGLVYQKDGAVWLKMVDGEDKVLIKSDGDFTYRVPDIAYHIDKYNRGYELLIDLFGPDQSHIPELKAGLSICGVPEEVLKIITLQWVTFNRGGQKIGMSKRKGEFITLDELLDEVGKEAARFFFLTRKCESHLDFDIELAKQTSKDNPVYYVQYVGARISSILKMAGSSEDRRQRTEDGGQNPKSQILPQMRDPEKSGTNSNEVQEFKSSRVQDFKWQKEENPKTQILNPNEENPNEEKVVSENIPLTNARLVLIKAVRQVISNGLSLIGIGAPEEM
ncbi:MAG: arginine--tRNA ligase [Candidatus Stahlbacteria bacterium]|nr:arginine--tRNA ligase [Candidatus Stahlbacteria bacterium]